MTDSNRDMLVLICQHHLTNGGNRSRFMVKRFLEANTDRELAETLLRHDPLYAPGKICTYGDADDFEPIFAKLRAGFPEWMQQPQQIQPKDPEPSVPC